MNGVNLTLRALHHGERSLARQLSAAAERHATEHEFHHVAKDLVVWSDEHCRRAADTGRHYGLHLAAAGNSLYWEVLARAAQALEDTRLLDLASACHPQTLRQMRWTNTLIKNLSPQILTSL
ncbi:hypothetical protein [Streptomyces sp. NPDC091268]|uniref:hypothetical protein n=1 Tax=Streptomyces sp. NPDC091268 TaxID=3365979 RepID=UPI00380BA48B